jgi:hypothetical protein
MVWGIRICMGILFLGFLFFLFMFIMVLAAAVGGDIEALPFLFFLVPGLFAMIIGLYEGVWRNSKYFLDEEGITFVYPVRSKYYPWCCFQKVFVSPIRRGVKDPKAHDYIILMISKCDALTRSLSVPECWEYQDHFLIVRKTEERMKEFSKYCTIEDKGTALL